VRRRVEPARGAAAALPRAGGRVPPRVLHWATDALYGALTVVLAPYAAARLLRDPKTRARWKAYARDVAVRFGRRRPRAGSRPCVWIHGVSVGEVKAAGHLVRRLESGWPGLDVVLSVTTDTGRRVAEELYPQHRVEFYPPDLSWVVRNALDALRPDLVVLMESEFWPNFLLTARERDIPVALVNGKLSEGSARRFGRARPLAAPLLTSLAAVCVQMPVYAERFLTLGLDPARVHVTGNMKLDNIPLRHADRQDERPFRDLLGGVPGRPVLVGGSTHPGEEEALARVAKGLAAAGTPVTLIVAPRHPGRVDDVERAVRGAGLEVVRRSRLPAAEPPPADAVRLLDTVGELEQAYALADAVFVGGTLVPHGGQNMMEPASQGRPVVVGPYVHNFRGEVELLLAAGGLAQVADEAGVAAVIRGWLADPAAARALGERARLALEGNKGATERTLEVLRPLIDRALADRA
jgi:3-deoxy-D-manno-octulosonic-acid transferase